jgi:uncharacterized lipoprotein YddW (UPF0748 family)
LALVVAGLTAGTAGADLFSAPAGSAMAESTAVHAPRGTVADSTRARMTVADTTHRDIEYLWVLRDALIDPAGIPRIVERAHAMGVKGLLVQVVGRGDGWYRSDILPYPEPILTPGRDPLGELLPLAHAAGLEVHAWVNCCLVWSAPQPPRDARHVLNAHPEWVARMADGRPMTRLTPAARERLRVEGVFLSPAHPGVRAWITDIVREIVTRYPVDGIQLDYIREPSVPIGFDPTTRARFAMEHGADPDPHVPDAPFHRAPAAERPALEAAWAEFQNAQVTAIVQAVRDTLAAIRPGLPLSAAVLADTLTALKRNHQQWSAWLRDRLLDRAFAMCYAPQVPTVLAQLTSMSAQVGTARLVPGIAIYNTPPSIAAIKIKGARALGFPAIALYSYDSLWERVDLWDRLRGYLNGPSTLEAQP